jgi:hypothetical protein
MGLSAGYCRLSNLTSVALPLLAARVLFVRAFFAANKFRAKKSPITSGAKSKKQGFTS